MVEGLLPQDANERTFVFESATTTQMPGYQVVQQERAWGSPAPYMQP